MEKQKKKQVMIGDLRSEKSQESVLPEQRESEKLRIINKGVEFDFDKVYALIQRQMHLFWIRMGCEPRYLILGIDIYPHFVKSLESRGKLEDLKHRFDFIQIEIDKMEVLTIEKQGYIDVAG